MLLRSNCETPPPFSIQVSMVEPGEWRNRTSICEVTEHFKQHPPIFWFHYLRQQDISVVAELMLASRDGIGDFILLPKATLSGAAPGF